MITFAGHFLQYRLADLNHIHAVYSAHTHRKSRRYDFQGHQCAEQLRCGAY